MFITLQGMTTDVHFFTDDSLNDQHNSSFNPHVRTTE